MTAPNADRPRVGTPGPAETDRRGGDSIDVQPTGRVSQESRARLLEAAQRAHAVAEVVAAHLANRPGWNLDDQDLAHVVARLAERVAEELRYALAVAS